MEKIPLGPVSLIIPPCLDHRRGSNNNSNPWI